MFNQKYKQIFEYLSSFLFFKRFILGSVIIFILTSIINNLYYFLEILKLSLGVNIFVSSFFDFSGFDNKISLFLYLLSIFLISFNISLMLKFFDDQKKLTSDSNKSKSILESIKSFVFIFLTVFVFHCASCGFVLFGGLVSIGSGLFFLKYSFYIQLFFIILICVNIWYNLKKIQNPFVC